MYFLFLPRVRGGVVRGGGYVKRTMVMIKEIQVMIQIKTTLNMGKDNGGLYWHGTGTVLQGKQGQICNQGSQG